MTTTRVYLIRHGQTDWNAGGRWQGALDIPLSEVGIGQAHRLAAHLRQYPITALYSSDLSRAAVTAQIVGVPLGIQPLLDPRWREFDLGVLGGLTHDEIRARHPEELQGLHDNYLDHRVQGGESRRMMMDRAFAAWNDTVFRGDREIAIVSHGGVIRILLYKLLDGSPVARSGHIENTSITTLDVTRDGLTLVSMGLLPHLEAEPSAVTPAGDAAAPAGDESTTR